MRRFLLYGHGGAYNHGAEAILRGTVPLLREAGGRILLSTNFPEQDREFGLDGLVDELIGADWALAAREKAAADTARKKELAREMYREALGRIDADTVCLAVGGDNYCYPNWHRQSIFHERAKEKGAKSILWGCSIEPSAIDAAMEAVLRGHDRIYARESHTRDALLQRGIGQVQLCRDPAFSMEAEAVVPPEGFVPGAMAALNLSPLMLRRDARILDYFTETARALLQRAEGLLLMPHVTMPADDDREALEALAARLGREEQKRLCRIPDSLNAPQRKYLISQCEMLVCCRTHASIAAYSTGVPVLVAGYSVKAAGIAADLGMEDWTLSAAGLPQLCARALRLWEERAAVRAKLKALRL